MATALTRTVSSVIFGSAVAGYGFSIGKDAWKSTKKHKYNIIIISAIVFALIGPYFAARNMVRYYRRGILGTLFLTIIGNMILWLAGVSLVFVGVHFLIELMSQNNLNINDYDIKIMTILIVLPSTFFGYLVGFFQRRKRKKACRIQEENDIFLENIGMSETEESDITHIDADGNNLRIQEIGKNRIVFMAVGKRNKRAFIKLDKEGKMINYTGVVSIA